MSHKSINKNRLVVADVSYFCFTFFCFVCVCDCRVKEGKTTLGITGGWFHHEAGGSEDDPCPPGTVWFGSWESIEQ